MKTVPPGVARAQQGLSDDSIVATSFGLPQFHARESHKSFILGGDVPAGVCLGLVTTIWRADVDNADVFWFNL